MTDRELVPTQSAYLALKAERAGMEEGYRFLDEKRLILAGEILANLRDYDATMARWRRAEARARAALRAAVGRHGLDELGVYPPLAAQCGLATSSRSVLGVRIEALAASGGGDPDGASAPADGARGGFGERAGERHPDGGSETECGDAGGGIAIQSPEAQACRAAFADLMPMAARLAVLTGNLERLRVEYLRTSRRARALEDVLLPEIDERLGVIDNVLEELEREEAVRVRRGRAEA
ncbi:V-type ATP synthase subunit D [uncultured Thiohalocapsa sp.]|uniref:V-type ATP synthase subunit D n=1 Tax=uncultured Thiohalocapsa sp. TaxID=768990 RepID=UPI0025E18477|nr:V-type ATP synthase subunit D [uncultured Thiohalocapsa sp.]